MTREKHKHRRTSILVAAFIYIVGVVILTGWAYQHHRHGHIEHMRSQQASNVTAVKELLKKDIQRLLLPDAPDSELFTTRKNQLRNIACNGDITLLGALDPNDPSRQITASGTDSEIPESPVNLILEQNAENKAIGTGSVYYQESGRFASAVLADEDSGILYFSVYDLDHHAGLQSDDVFRNILSALILIILALPLVFVTRKAERTFSLETEALNARLKQDVSLQKTREEELKDAISDLERFNAVSAGRESRIMELKHEVNELLDKLNLEKRYSIDQAD